MFSTITNTIPFSSSLAAWRGIIFFCMILIHSHTFSQSITEDTLKIKEIQVIAKRPLAEIGIQKSKIDTLIIKASESASLSELLSENTAVFVKSAGRGSLATVSFRGTAASHTDVLWNGMTLKSPMFGEIDFSLIPLFFVDDISLLHGGASISNTSGALGGSIQIDNKPDWDRRLAFKFKQDIGSFSTYNDYLSWSVGNKKVQSKTRIFYNYSKNDFEFLNQNNADIDPVTGDYIYSKKRNENGDYKQYGVLQEWYLRLGQKWNASVKYWGQKSDRGLPRLNTYEGHSFSNISNEEDLTHRFIAELSRFGNKSKLNISSGIIYRDMQYTMQNFISGSGYQTIKYSNSQSKSLFNKVDYTYNYSKNTVFSTQYAFNFHDVFSKDTIEHYAYSEERLEYFLFFSWQQKWIKRLSSVVFLRQNFIDDKLTPSIPYLGLDYLLSEKHQWIAKASISKNYRVPTLNDLFWQPSGNINLKPEQGWSSDLSLSSKWEIKTMQLQISSSVYYSDISDWILWMPSAFGYWSPENMKRVVSKGVELYFTTDFSIQNLHFKWNANYAYTSSVNKDSDPKWGTESYNKQLVYVPLHAFNCFAQISWKKWALSYQHNSYSERFTTSTNDFSRRDWLYPYFMNNLMLSKSIKLRKINLNVQFYIYNLFNEEYRSILFRPMPKRNYLLSFSIQF